VQSDWLRIVQHQLGRLEQHFVLGVANLGLDDFDGQVFLVTADESGGAIPDGFGTRVGVHERRDA
jgi:hypothetical protein